MRDGGVVMDGPIGSVVSGNQVAAPERMAAGAAHGG
jgi:ATP-binding cassette subfamily C protein LapB